MTESFSLWCVESYILLLLGSIMAKVKLYGWRRKSWWSMQSARDMQSSYCNILQLVTASYFLAGTTLWEENRDFYIRPTQQHCRLHRIQSRLLKNSLLLITNFCQYVSRKFLESAAYFGSANTTTPFTSCKKTRSLIFPINIGMRKFCIRKFLIKIEMCSFQF